MDDKTTEANAEIKTVPSLTAEEKTAEVQSASPSPEIAGSEKRQAYGTAKTENLRDTGLWRFFILAAVLLFCLALFVIPLLILIPLLLNSITGIITNDGKEAQLLWVWITMIVLEVAVWIVIVRGLLKIFMTQAGNYQRA